MPILRPAVPADRNFLLTLANRLADFPRPDWRSAEEIAHADDHLIEAALAAPDTGTLLLIAEEPAGTPAGGVLVTTREDYFTQERHAHIEVLAVTPEAARQGIARLMVRAAEEWATARGYRHITLNVFDGNTRARSLYEHLGYLPETTHYYKPLTPE